jgi:putative membrane protein
MVRRAINGEHVRDGGHVTLKKLLPSLGCVLVLSLPVLAQAKTSPADRAFMQMAARANMTEAHIGQMAETQASESQVKDFGQTLIHDHTDAYTQLTALAAKTGESIPKGIDVRKISTVEQLMKLKGKRFDHQFVQAEIRDHEKAIADFKREAQHGQDPDVKAYASKMIPVLEGHLRQAKALVKPVEPRSRARRRSNTVSA